MNPIDCAWSTRANCASGRVPAVAAAARVDVDRHRDLRHLVVDAVHVNRERAEVSARETPAVYAADCRFSEVIGHDRDVGGRQLTRTSADRGRHTGPGYVGLAMIAVG